jgi:phosphoribosyl-ATP pyrophosphohydrolase/phosphoribosyl-AMP cyclohydrolase/histidinol dehydrogenase
MPAGPSELLVIADDSAEPRYVVSDLLSQAEHGVDSQVVLLAVGFSFEKLQVYQKELFKQATALPRKDIVKVSLSKSYILSMDTLDEAMAFSNQYAPEHLILNIKEANTVLDKVMNAGSVFVGPYSPERYK